MTHQQASYADVVSTEETRIAGLGRLAQRALNSANGPYALFWHKLLQFSVEELNHLAIVPMVHLDMTQNDLSVALRDVSQEDPYYGRLRDMLETHFRIKQPAGIPVVPFSSLPSQLAIGKTSDIV